MKKLACLLCVILVLITMSASAFVNVVTTDYIITNNGNKLFSSEDVFIENGMVYLPLEELLNKLDFKKNSDNYLHIENNKISLYVAGGSYNDIYNMEIGKRQIVYTQSPKTTSPATRETMYAPLLRNDLIYIPFEYMDYIFNSPFADTGLYHIELKGNTEQTDFKKIDDGSVSLRIPNANLYKYLIVGSCIVFLIIAFVAGYFIGKKKRV